MTPADSPTADSLDKPIAKVSSLHGPGTLRLKTTVEIPDLLFRQAKAAAAQRGVSLKEFFTEAVRTRLRDAPGPAAPDRPWRKAFGSLRGLHRETQRLEGVIAAEFERIDEEEWR